MPNTSPSISDDLARAQDALNTNDLATAKALYESVIRRDPTKGLAYVGLGQVAYQSGFLDDAAAFMDEAYDICLDEHDGIPPRKASWSPKNEPLLRAIHGQGLIAYRQGDSARAIDRFTLLLRLNPSDEQGAAILLAGVESGKSWRDLG